MEFWQVIEGRHSVRDFSEEPVDRAVLERVISAAALAPSSMNAQPARFHVCQGESRSAIGKLVSQATVHLTEYMDVLGPERYEEAVSWYSSLGNAPVVICVSCPRPESEFDTLNKWLSVGAAIENLLLGCTAEGLGACNITFAMWAKDEIGRAIGLVEDREIVAIVAVGRLGAIPPASPPHIVDIADWLD